MDKQEIRARSMELALQFVGMIYELPEKLPFKIEPDSDIDETGIINGVLEKTKYLCKQFEEIIGKGPQPLPLPSSKGPNSSRHLMSE